MKLTFLYHPVKDLTEAVAFYRDTLGLDEAWREGDETVAFALPGSDIQVMLDATDDDAGPSGFFEVEDIDAFHAARADSVTWIEPPKDLPPVRTATFSDSGGNVVRIFQPMEGMEEME